MSANTIDPLIQLQSPITPLENIEILQFLAKNHELKAIPTIMELLQHHHQGIVTASAEALIQLAPESVEPLINLFYSCRDQNVQAQIIKILATIGDDVALDLLVDLVGVEIANHCQGNVRRVAARGLGKMVTANTELQQVLKAVHKLTWALLHTEDWALRYAAALSLKEIAQKNLSISHQITDALHLALNQESDQVVQERIKLLIFPA